MCHSCPSAFIRDAQLKLHIDSVHLKLKPYKCDKCNKEGSTIKQLVLWKSPKILIIVLKRFIGDIKLEIAYF